jgi:uncharacterized protein involved in exopolysaccharide biosynthesis
MNDVYLQIITYLSGVWRRRWLVLALAWLVCGAGWTTVASLPDRYQSQARIYVDVDTMLGPLMKGIAVEMNLFQQIDIMRRTLLSRPNVEKIILMTDLDLTVKNEEGKERLVEELAARIHVKQQGRNLFEIAYEDTDPAMTKRVVQAVMQIFVEGNLGASRKDMETTRRFLDGQIKDYERQLVAAEQRLAAFKRKNMGMLPGEGNNYYDHMQKMRQQLSATEAKISESVMIRNEFRSQLKEVPQFLEVAGENPLAQVSANASRGPDSDLMMRMLEMQQVIDSLMSRYTEKHPDVLTAKRRLEALKKELATEQAGPGAALDHLQNVSGPAGAEVAALDGGPAVSAPVAAPEAAPAPAPIKNMLPNPVYEQIKMQLVQQEGVIAALKNRAETGRKDVEKWSSMAKLVPQVEAELAQLDRDYNIVKKGYQELRQRQESAKLAHDLETKAQKVQFRVIDPPKMPLKPSGPNRPILLAAVLFAGLVVGIAFAFLLSQINTTFSSVHRLRATFTLPVLGRVSAVVSRAERRTRMRELVGFAMVCFALVAAFGGLVGIEMFGAGGLMTKIKGLGII